MQPTVHSRPEQRVKLEHAIRGHDHECLWLVLLLSGIRIDADATWDDVDFAHARLIVRQRYRRAIAGPIVSGQKQSLAGGRSHWPNMPLPHSMASVLEHANSNSGRCSGRISTWYSRFHGGDLRADKVLRALKVVLRSAGLPERRLHDLVTPTRRTAMPLTSTRAPYRELLGHSRFDMPNDLYVGSVPDALRDAVERLDRTRSRQSTLTPF